MATPILTDVRRRFPNAEITAMCRSGLSTLLEHDPDIDELFSFTRPSGWLKRDEKRSIIQKLRTGKYDLGLLLTGSFSSAWWFYRGGVKKRLGFQKDGRGIFLSKSLPFPKDVEERHLITTYKQLLEPLGVEPSNTAPRIHLLESEVEGARTLLIQHGVPLGAKILGVNPGAAYGSAKCWLPERFREVSERLLQDPELYIVYFGDISQAPLVKKICSGLPSRVVNLAGSTTLRELAALLSQCKAVLTNDSGPMHLAAALDVPLLALFGSTNSVKTGPYNSTGVVIHKQVECAPCYQRTCPIDFRCMKQITTDEVTTVLRELLDADAFQTANQ